MIQHNICTYRKEYPLTYSEATKHTKVLDGKAESHCWDITLTILGNGSSTTRVCAGGHVKIGNSIGLTYGSVPLEPAAHCYSPFEDTYSLNKGLKAAILKSNKTAARRCQFKDTIWTQT